MEDLRSLFLLADGITYLNHGSFGACPQEVFDCYQGFQRKLESQPAQFLGRQINGLMADSRQALACFLNVREDEVVYFTNPTTAINMVVRNLDLEPGAEILSTNHEYGAMNRTWRYIARKMGAKFINRPIPITVSDPAQVVEEFWQGVTPHTRIIFISHITSPTALVFPIQEICRRASQAGILTIIDGAHAPGQLPLDLGDLGANIYTGALHKWLCAPKGAAFLYVDREHQALFDPLVVSWGYQSEAPSGSQFIDYHEWQGTRDMSAFLSVPAAINFQEKHDWTLRRGHLHQLAANARKRLVQLEGFSALSLDPGTADVGEYRWFAQMVALQLPECDVRVIQQLLFDQYQIEIPVFRWEGLPIMRISIQAYNTPRDVDRLVFAVQDIIQHGYFNH